jgi:hypothetical protein
MCTACCSVPTYRRSSELLITRHTRPSVSAAATTTIKSTSIESVKYPLENRIWYNYAGQTNPIYAGTYEQPTATGRVLDDGSTQLAADQCSSNAG